jgi:hypothetical protein
MRNNTDFKVLLRILDSSLLFIICDLLTAQCMSECQEILQDTELRNIVLQFVLVKRRSILCYIALLIGYESWYCRIVNFFCITGASTVRYKFGP